MKFQKNSEQIIKETVMESILVKQRLLEKSNDIILEISKYISEALSKGRTIYLFGNGGSAADAQHVAAEFVGRFTRERRALPAEALTTNTSILTAIGNDYDFAKIFSRQVEAKVHSGDVVIGISTSGKSKNVIYGLKSAKSIGAKTIGFTGAKPYLMSKFTDICLCVPSESTPRIQESHILAWHIISDLVEKEIEN
jgi:D-sedoheptulose 7-phosphate isomerase